MPHVRTHNLVMTARLAERRVVALAGVSIIASFPSIQSELKLRDLEGLGRYSPGPRPSKSRSFTVTSIPNCPALPYSYSATAQNPHILVWFQWAALIRYYSGH